MQSKDSQFTRRGKTVYGAERTDVKVILGPSSMGTRATLSGDGAECYPVQSRVTALSVAAE